nr:MAG TPA: hypothetical protein [Caudoviricetes sp.]
MEQIITLKVDLEHPDDAKFAIDEAVKVYEADRLKWTEEEIAEAKHLAMKIMEQLCLDGYSIEWCGVTEAYYYKAVSVWLSKPDDESFKRNAACCIPSASFDTWVAKYVCLCRATGRDVPAFITKKAGECW